MAPELEQTQLLRARHPVDQRFPSRGAAGSGAADLEPIDRQTAGQAAPIGDPDASIAFAMGNAALLPTATGQWPPPHHLPLSEAEYGETV